MSQQVPSGDLDRLDVDELRRFFARRWRLIVGTAIACTCLAIAVCLSLKPLYTATSQVLLDPHRQHVFGQDSVVSDASLDSSVVDSQISIITSTRLLATVIGKENLTVDPEFAAAAKPGLLDHLFHFLRPAKVNEVEEPVLDGIDPKLAPVIVHLFGRIEVTRVAKSNVLSIAVSSRNAAKATRLANSLAATYVADQIDVRARSVQQAATFFEDRLGRLRDQVRTSEKAVADFRREHNLTTTTMEGTRVTVGEQQLQDLNQQLALATTDTAEKLARYQQAATFKLSGANVDTLPEIIRSPLITQLRSQQADLMRRESDLSSTYGPAFPAITQINAQKVGLDRAIAVEIKRLTATLHNDYQVAKAREDALRRTIGDLTKVSGGDNDVGVRLRELERTNQANSALFENFLSRAKLTQEQSSFEEPEARLISPALQPTSPTFPKTRLIVAVAAIAGLIFGLGAAAAVERLGWPQMRRRRRRNSPAAGGLILGRIADAGQHFASAADLTDLFAATPPSSFARDLSAVAAKFDTFIRTARQRSLALVPAKAGEDASAVALGLAMTLGQKGRRVLLVDADADHRWLTSLCGAAGRPGLADLVAGRTNPAEATWAQPRFALLPFGRGEVEAGAVDGRMRELLRDAQDRFDLVILVTAACASPRAAATLSALVGAVALVSHLGGEREGFVAAVDATAGLPNFMGLVLTGTDRDDQPDYALVG